MALILHIETSSPVCSVSIARDGTTLAEKTTAGTNDHMARITLDIQEVCNVAGVTIGQLEAIAISAGPGSYTGLRIGTSVAKGLCHALGIPLLAIPTLRAMVEQIKQRNSDPQVLFCPMIDARRMEVYTMVTDASGDVVVPQMAYVANEETLSFIPANRRTIIFGSGAEKLIAHFSGDLTLDTRYVVSACDLHSLANQQFYAGNFADLPYFEPEYIKEFYTPAKKQG